METLQKQPQVSGDNSILNYANIVRLGDSVYIRCWASGKQILVPFNEFNLEMGAVKSGGAKNESDIISGIISIEIPGSWTKLKLTSLEAVRIKSNVGIPNFAITVDNSENENSVEVTVEDENGDLLKKSASAGNIIPAGKTVQVTAVGDCFTLAVFE